MTEATVPSPTQRLLTAELDVLCARLHAFATDTPEAQTEITSAESRLAAIRSELAYQTPLDALADGFSLTVFERAMLLLTAGPQLVSAVGDELEAIGGVRQATFGLAMRILPEAHWDAMTTSAPLRQWELIRLREPTSPPNSLAVVDERVLHQIAGAGCLDEELSTIAAYSPAPTWFPGPLKMAAGEVARSLGKERAVLVHGPQVPNLRAVAAAAAADAGLRLLVLSAADLPTDPASREHTVRLMERETVLSGCAWSIDIVGANPDQIANAMRAISRMRAPVLVVGEMVDVVDAATRRLEPIAVPRIDLAHRRELLEFALRSTGLSDDHPANAEINLVAGIFDLDLDAASAAAEECAAGMSLWSACRRASRAAFDGLAVVVQPRARWDDLILPDLQMKQLRALVSAVRHRTTVLDDWGFGGRTTEGLGSTALFSGSSGTGKSLAGEVIAADLSLDLVRVDLSQVVSKYIGETEKNLRRLFDAAEDAAAILLFNEADALFGPRSEVRDSHDRYANIEVSYLLQRLESYRGLAILTTNDQTALDPAFLRRLRTIVEFPYPDTTAREALWRLAFPPETPLFEIEPHDLARIDLSGGGISAAALTAAYLAAEDQEAVSPHHVRLAAQWELAKSGRVLAEKGS